MGKGRIVLIAGVLGLCAANPEAAAQSEGLESEAKIALVTACLQEEGETVLPEKILDAQEEGQAVKDPDMERDQSGIERPSEEDLSLPALPASDIPPEEHPSNGTEETKEEELQLACQEPAVEDTGGTGSVGHEQQLSEEDLSAAGTVRNELESQPDNDKEETGADSESDAASDADDGKVATSEEPPAEMLAKEGAVSTASTSGAVIETDIEIETISPAFPAQPSEITDRYTDSSRTEPGADGSVKNSGNRLDRSGQNRTTFRPSRSADKLGNGTHNSERKTSQNGPDHLPKTGGPLGKNTFLFISLFLISAGVSLNWVSRRKRSVR